jgi:Cu-Zn family superoxide dismutase
MKTNTGILALLLAAAAVAAQPETQEARADLKDAKGKQVGTASFVQTPKGVHVVVDVTGFQPGPKGIHIHEKGDCSSPDFKSAGAHLKTDDQHHGLENAHGPHAGDLPNLVVDKDGHGHLDVFTDRVTVTGLLREGGTAFVIHAKEDDQKSDPAGNSGDRLVCGVIKH